MLIAEPAPDRKPATGLFGGQHALTPNRRPVPLQVELSRRLDAAEMAARDCAPSFRRKGSHANLDRLFLVDDVPQDKVGQLGHKGPKAGVLLKQRNHVSIQISIRTIFIAL